MREPLDLAVAQLDARPGELAANAARVAAAASAAAADLLLTPELSLTGYDVRDAAVRLARRLRDGEPLPAPFEPLREVPGTVIAGLLERGDDEVPYNVAAVLESGVVRYRHRKLYLPTYGMFDEGRYFGRGRRVEPFPLARGWRGGILVCEDFWHPGLAYVHAAAGADVLLVLAAGPGRGAWEGGEHGDFASADAWERIARSTAQLYGIYVALANRCGVEAGVTFAGASLIVAPSGEVLARAGTAVEETIRATLDPDALARARQPGYHGRDDDPALVVRELERLGLA